VNSYFGEFWDVPSTEGASQVPTPVGQKCLDCTEEIAKGDRGYIMPAFRSPAMFELLPVHRECQLLGVIGHNYGWCSCTNYQGLSRRQAALELWDQVARATR